MARLGGPGALFKKPLKNLVSLWGRWKALFQKWKKCTAEPIFAKQKFASARACTAKHIFASTCSQKFQNFACTRKQICKNCKILQKIAFIPDEKSRSDFCKICDFAENPRNLRPREKNSKTQDFPKTADFCTAKIREQIRIFGVKNDKFLKNFKNLKNFIFQIFAACAKPKCFAPVTKIWFLTPKIAKFARFIA